MKQAISKWVLLGGAVMWFSASAFADDEDVIKFRENVMKAYAAHMAAAGAIVQGKVKGSAVGHAKALEATTQDMAAMFPAGSDFGETNALDTVWSKRADFERKAKDTQAKAPGSPEGSG